MVIIGEWNDHPVTLSVKPNCLTLSLEKGGSAEVFSFDFAGRMWTALLEEVSYRRGLDGKIVAKWQTKAGGRERRWLTGERARQVEARAREVAAGLYAAIINGQASLQSPLPEQGRLGFERAAAFDAERTQADIQRYYQVYKPVGILPPDQYMAVVLQATEGCAFNTCTFCDFYRDRRFRIKSEQEFLQHAQDVRDFVGDGLSLRRTIFLGDANALIAPMPKLAPLMEVVHRVYDVEALGGIFAFLDGFSAEKKSPQDYEILARLGLERVYVGMESGNSDLLKFLKKPGKPEDAVHAVQSMKAAGVAVGVIVLLGAGGQTFAQDHIRDTIKAINAMHLDMHDIIYFSELITSEGMQYVQDAYQLQLNPLGSQARIAQGELIENGLKFSRRGGTPHISRYDIREFVY
jgi:hypothetical protein